MPLIPSFEELYHLLPDCDGVPQAEAIAPEDMPEPYRSLLVHDHHMTVTVEQHYGCPVNVQVLQFQLTDQFYSRKILLSLQDGGKVVQFGIVRINLHVLSPTVRDQIIEGNTPLGRVLIQNDVLRRVKPTSFLKVIPHKTMCDWFGLDQPCETYGRLGVIYTDDRPAIEVLEILVPVVG